MRLSVILNPGPPWCRWLLGQAWTHSSAGKARACDPSGENTITLTQLGSKSKKGTVGDGIMKYCVKENLHWFIEMSLTLFKQKAGRFTVLEDVGGTLVNVLV